MRTLTIGDLDLALRDLFVERQANLVLLICAQVYLPQLQQQRAVIEALAPTLSGRALADQLAEADDHHDGFGGSIWDYTEAILTAPDLSDATRAAALRVRETFLPKRSQLADSYAEEAAKAKKNRPKLDALEGDLKSMPLPDGKTLYDWVKGFLDSGETLDKLLSARASAEANASLDGQHDKVRKATIKLLGRFREALRDEVELNTKLPRDLEGKVFGYVDELASRRTKRKKTGGEAGTAEGTGAG